VMETNERRKLKEERWNEEVMETNEKTMKR
jgi:hypothetical protein